MISPPVLISTLHGTDDNVRFNLHSFWADHKKQLPLHYGVYLTEVGCIRAAAGSVKTIFSGAGKFTAEAPSSGATLLRMMVRNHENYQYLSSLFAPRSRRW